MKTGIIYIFVNSTPAPNQSTHPPAVEAQSPNYRTTREIPLFLFRSDTPAATALGACCWQNPVKPHTLIL